MPVITSLERQPEADNQARIYAAYRPRLGKEEIREILDDLVRRGGLTLRDEMLLEYLRELNVLSLNQAHRLLWKPETSEHAAYRRMHFLSRRHLLERVRTPRAEMEAWGLKAGLVYALGPGGRMWLQEEVNDDVVNRRLKRDQVLHDLLVAEVCVRLGREVLRRGPQWSLVLYGDRTSRYYESASASKPLVAPDGLVIIRYRPDETKELQLPMFVELDASREAHGRPSSRWGRKVRGYDALSGLEWQAHPPLRDLEQFPRVLVITHGAQRLLNLVEAILKHRKSQVVYHLALWSDLMESEDILTAPVWLVITPDGQVVGREADQRQPLIKAKK